MRNIILSVIAAMSAMLAVSCQKGDGEADYGNSLIYIPQATVSAGIDNYYNVPSGGAENTLNFGTTETDVDIYLGVMLSGKKAGSGFSVNIVEDSEASISAAAALGATVLPLSAYELPSVVNVASGRNSGTFSLVLHKEFVMENGGTCVLALRLADPSAYKLSSKATSVVVVIDVDSLKKYL